MKDTPLALSTPVARLLSSHAGTRQRRGAGGENLRRGREAAPRTGSPGWHARSQQEPPLGETGQEAGKETRPETQSSVFSMNKTWLSSQTEGEVIRTSLSNMCLLSVSSGLQGFVLQMGICIAGAAALWLVLLRLTSCFSLCQEPGFSSVHDSAVNTWSEDELEQQGSFPGARSRAG